MSGTSLAVLKAFVGGANAQYRAAGLSDYQMKVGKDGSVTTPNRPDPKFRAPKASGSAAGEQATAGAAAQTPSSTVPQPGVPAMPPGAEAPRAETAPKITGLQQGGADAFRLTWSAVAGAKQYGIWQDGALVGHVTSPSFAGQLAVGASGTIQVDAVRADGTRTALTKALRATRGQDGKLVFDAGGASAPPASPAGPTAPATAPG